MDMSCWSGGVVLGGVALCEGATVDAMEMSSYFVIGGVA